MALSRPLTALDLQFKCQSLDPQLRSKIMQLSIDAECASVKLMKCVSTQKANILKQTRGITLAQSLSEIDLRGLSSTVEVAKKDVESVRNTIPKLQTDIQALVDPCQGKRVECKGESIKKQLEICENKELLMHTTLGQLTGALALMIHEFNLEQASVIADRVSTARNINAGVGFGASGIMLAVGIGFAPFTGGISLIPTTVVAAGNALVAALRTVRYNNEIDHWKEEARDQRRRAAEERGQIEQLQKRNRECRNTIATLQTKIVELQQAREVLESWITKLLQAYNVALDVYEVLQDVDRAITEADLHTRTTAICQGNFAGNPTLTARTATCLGNLKKSWRVLQNALQTSEQKLM